MNYYIQGDAAKAEQIKAAFEELGYSTSLHTFFDEDTVFITLNGNICECNYGGAINELIKTHPDYKELELPVEPKFKEGDWVVRWDDAFTVSIRSVRDENYYFHQGGSLPIKEVDKYYHLWTIADAKDGDVLVTTKVRSCPFIYRKTSYNNNLAYYYAGIDGNGDFCEGCLKRTLFHFGSVENVVPATKEQRDLLFAKMKEAGYEWDAGKKELRKIKPHYDIKNFKPKQWVLVRDDDEWEWALTRFSYLSNGSASLFVCINGASFQQCIPFEGNEHLLGTTDMPSEEYINW